MRMDRAIMAVGLVCLLAVANPVNAGQIVAWGDNSSGQVSGAPAGPGFTAIAAGAFAGYALRANGSIAAWGSNAGAPAGTGFTAVAGGYDAGYALRADGSIVG